MYVLQTKNLTKFYRMCLNIAITCKTPSFINYQELRTLSNYGMKINEQTLTFLLGARSVKTTPSSDSESDLLFASDFTFSVVFVSIIFNIINETKTVAIICKLRRKNFEISRLLIQFHCNKIVKPYVHSDFIDGCFMVRKVDIESFLQFFPNYSACQFIHSCKNQTICLNLQIIKKERNSLLHYVQK